MCLALADVQHLDARYALFIVLSELDSLQRNLGIGTREHRSVTGSIAAPAPNKGNKRHDTNSTKRKQGKYPATKLETEKLKLVEASSYVATDSNRPSSPSPPHRPVPLHSRTTKCRIAGLCKCRATMDALFIAVPLAVPMPCAQRS